MSDFLPWRGNYKDLIIYRKSTAVYDMAYFFAHRYLERGDRTVDQMVQAARSCKQNIVEGVCAATTSMETELKLVNVAKASLHELMEDYEDYLRVHGHPLWKMGEDTRTIDTRPYRGKKKNNRNQLFLVFIMP